ncbi:MAG: transketolase family protein [Egibacteraceae bacterium]
MTTLTMPRTMREAFVEEMHSALDDDPRVALVLADISAGLFTIAGARHPSRVINVGIREQAMIGVAGGLALSGLRPVVHTYAPFLVERPFEQVKLDLGHQDVGAVLVSIGASHDWAEGGRTHMAPGDVALLDTLPGWTVHVPGHAGEAVALLRQALRTDDRVYLRLSDQANAQSYPVGAGLRVLRRGSAGVVLAVGPTLTPALDALSAVDATVLYTATVRPFDAEGLRAAVRSNGSADVVLIEPYLRGTSTHVVAEALRDVPHRVLALGVGRDAELRRYGTAAEHNAAHGLDAATIRAAVHGFLR